MAIVGSEINGMKCLKTMSRIFEIDRSGEKIKTVRLICTHCGHKTTKSKALFLIGAIRCDQCKNR